MISTNVRIREETLAEIARAAEISGENQADVIRLAIQLGMDRLEKIGFDPSAVIQAKVNEIEAAERASTSQLPVNRGPRSVKAKPKNTSRD